MRRRPIVLMAVVLVALGIYVYLSSRPEPAPLTPPRPSIWLERLVLEPPYPEPE